MEHDHASTTTSAGHERQYVGGRHSCPGAGSAAAGATFCYAFKLSSLRSKDRPELLMRLLQIRRRVSARQRGGDRSADEIVKSV